MQDFIIDLNIDSSKFKDIGRSWKKVEKAIERGIADGEAEFIVRLKQKIIENLGHYGLDTGNLVNSIVLEQVSGGVAIKCNSEYAAFVEYGTGIIGQQNPHPNPKITWIYRSGKNSAEHEGWYYPTTPDDPNPYKHTFNGQLYAYTKGQVSRPFMYTSWLWGTRAAKNIINKHIRRQIKNAIGGM